MGRTPLAAAPLRPVRRFVPTDTHRCPPELREAHRADDAEEAAASPSFSGAQHLAELRTGHRVACPDAALGRHSARAVSEAVAQSIPPRSRRDLRTVVHGIVLEELHTLRQERTAVRSELGSAPDDVAMITVANSGRKRPIPSSSPRRRWSSSTSRGHASSPSARGRSRRESGSSTPRTGSMAASSSSATRTTPPPAGWLRSVRSGLSPRGIPSRHHGGDGDGSARRGHGRRRRTGCGEEQAGMTRARRAIRQPWRRPSPSSSTTASGGAGWRSTLPPEPRISTSARRSGRSSPSTERPWLAARRDWRDPQMQAIQSPSKLSDSPRARASRAHRDDTRTAVDARDFLRIIRRRWVLLVIPPPSVWSSPSSTAPGRPEANRTYTATHTLVAGPEQPTSPTGGGSETAVQSVEVLTVLVQSGDVPERVAERLGSSDSAALVAGSVAVEADDQLGTLQYAAAGGDPERVTETANAFAEELDNVLVERANRLRRAEFRAGPVLRRDPRGTHRRPRQAHRRITSNQLDILVTAERVSSASTTNRSIASRTCRRRRPPVWRHSKRPQAIRRFAIFFLCGVYFVAAYC